MFASCFWQLMLFAQQGGGGAAPPQNGGSNLLGMLIPILGIGFIFYFLMIRPQSKEKQKRQEMLSNVKKNDRVLTIGGIYGVVQNVHKEADEVILKVDEGNNTKLRVSLSSIARVLSGAPGEETKSA